MLAAVREYSMNLPIGANNMEGYVLF